MEAPSFGETCPTSRIVVAKNSTTSAVVTWAPVKVTDNHQANLTVFPAVTPPHIFSEGDHTVTYTAKDPSGNIKQCSFKITVQGKNDCCFFVFVFVFFFRGSFIYAGSFKTRLIGSYRNIIILVDSNLGPRCLKLDLDYPGTPMTLIYSVL